MTTVVYDPISRIMASDSQATLGDMILNTKTDKIFNIRGTLVGAAGRYVQLLAFVDWLDEHLESENLKGLTDRAQITPPQELIAEDFTAIVVWSDTGEVSIFEGSRAAFTVADEGPLAIGSGAHFALAALDAGASPVEAVKIAIKRDIYSGGDVQMLEFNKTEDLYVSEADADKMSSDELRRKLGLICGWGYNKKDSSSQITSQVEDVTIFYEDEFFCISEDAENHEFYIENLKYKTVDVIPLDGLTPQEISKLSLSEMDLLHILSEVFDIEDDDLYVDEKTFKVTKESLVDQLMDYLYESTHEVNE